MNKFENNQRFSPASQLMAIEVISELLLSMSPNRRGESLCEYLRELSGAKTAIILVHHPEPELDELLNVSPLRRATLFSPFELNQFCHEKTPEKLPYLTEELPLNHPLKAMLLNSGILSLARFPLRAGGELVGILLLFDLPGVERIEETDQIINLLAPPIALALKNSLAFRQIEQQSLELEQRVEERTIELRESRALFQIAIDSSPIPIMIHDEEGRVLQLSRGWTKLSGYALEDIPNLGDWMERAYGERSGTKKDYIENLFATDQTVYNGEWTITAKDGSIRIWEFQSTPLGKLSKGKRVLLSMATDITERKLAEEEKVKLESQLQQSQKMESIGRLAGGVAHDFNNMLSVILGHAEMALMKIEPSNPLFDKLTEIQKAGERSADLTKQLLAFARQQTISPKALDLNDTVAGMLKMLQRLIGEGINLTWQPAANLWQVMVDPSQIDQILANLCINARDAINDIGMITIETENRVIGREYCSYHVDTEPGEYVLISVSDNGSGMDRVTQMHLFEPFFTTKEIGKGTGLGLATVYGIVKQNRGFINVYSEPGRGTTFSIYLPRHMGQTEEHEVVEEAEMATARGETVLLVEDEATLLVMSREILEMLGYNVLAASSANEAIRLSREYSGEIHLLMTDVVMPEMNGRDLAEKITPARPDMKSLFMSGYTADIIAHHGVLDPGVHFIQKPFSIQTLASKIREVLSQQMVRQGSVLNSPTG
jgi:PAS domain S-box-containing protein